MIDFKEVPMKDNMALSDAAYFEGRIFFESILDKLDLRQKCYTNPNGSFDDYQARLVLESMILGENATEERLNFLSSELETSLSAGKLNKFSEYCLANGEEETLDIINAWKKFKQASNIFYSHAAREKVSEKNSLIDFDEDYGLCYSEKSIFAYSEERRFM